jgi:hypothetical protein
MDRKEAERIYDAGREAVVEALMAFDARIRKLEETIARLTRNSSNSSRPAVFRSPRQHQAQTQETEPTQAGWSTRP